MGPFWGRVIGYIFLSWALALAAGPFEDVVYQDRMTEPSLNATRPTGERVGRPVDWFRMGRYPAAAVCLALGLAAAARLYRRRPGINLNPGWLGLIGDLIMSLFLAVAAYAIIDYLLHNYAGTHLVLGEPLAAQVITAGFIPGAMFLAAFGAGQFSQSVEVDDRGVTIHRPGQARLIPWDGITEFELHETYALVGRLGVPVPRKVQTKLKIETEPWPVSLVEPGLARTKRELLAALIAHAPERLRHNLEKIGEEW